jgi:hypothetical protein
VNAPDDTAESEDPRDDPGFERLEPHEQTSALLGAILDALYDLSDQIGELDDTMTGLNRTLKWH